MSLFSPFPAFETPRLRLRCLVPADAPAVFAIQSDPLVVRYFGRDPDLTLADSERRVADIIAGVADETSVRWGLTLAASGELIGTAGFWRWHKPHRLAEIGYDLASAHWGRGLMTEALRPLLHFGFTRMDLHRIEANLDPANQGSVRVLEKLGFVREGLLRENWFYAGQYTDTGTYGLLAGEFASK